MQLHEYQRKGVDHLLENEASGLFFDMGLGKTLTSLTAIDRLMFEQWEVRKVLVIAPKKVAQTTWSDEVAKWSHLNHLRVSVCVGTEAQRLAALKAEADIYTINRENVVWLVALYQSKFPFDMVVIDELSSFKNPQSKRFKALRRVRPLVNRVVGLTGTPAPNGLIDLWSQIYLLDQGERLGKTITGFRDAWFKPDKRNGPVVFNYKPKDNANEIKDRISDICIYMDAADYLDLPGRIDRDHWVTLTPGVYKRYKDFERDLVLQLLESGEEINAANAGVLHGKLRQFANGAVYAQDGTWRLLHDEKLDALVEDIEATQDNCSLVFYQYQHDRERILKTIKGAVFLRGPDEIKAWNEGKIKVLVAHAASAGHGLNLQDGGHYCFWYGLDWSLESYLQGVKRLDRQGQKQRVINTRLLCRGTVDELVLQALTAKTSVQDSILQALRVIIERHRP